MSAATSAKPLDANNNQGGREEKQRISVMMLVIETGQHCETDLSRSRSRPQREHPELAIPMVPPLKLSATEFIQLLPPSTSSIAAPGAEDPGMEVTSESVAELEGPVLREDVFLAALSPSAVDLAPRRPPAAPPTGRPAAEKDIELPTAPFGSEKPGLVAPRRC